MRIFSKLLISVLSAVLIVFAGLGYVSYTTNQLLLTGEIHRRALSLLEMNVAQLSDAITNIENVAVTVATGYLSIAPLGNEAIKRLIQQSLKNDPSAYGSGLVFKPSVSGEDGYAPHYYRKGGQLHFRDLATADYDYTDQDWYAKPMLSGKDLWSDPHLEAGGIGTNMMTYAYPIRRDGIIEALATVDVSINELTKLVDTIKVGTTGYAFLIGKDGTILSMPHGHWEFKKTIYDVANALDAPNFKNLGKQMIAGMTGFMPFDDPVTGIDGWAVYGPVPATGWSLAIMLPQAEVMGALITLHHNMILKAGLGLLALVLILLLISMRITKPIHDLAEAAEHITDGNFETTLPAVPTHDEIGTLTRSFATMQKSLAQTINNLHEEKELFQTSFAEMTDALIVLDTQWQILQINRAAERLFTLPPTTTFLNHLSEHFESSLPMTEIANVTRRTLLFRLVRRKDDIQGELYLDCTATPIYDDANTLKHYVVSAHDVTDIETSDRSKRTFLALISHKLFTPITPLQSNVSMLKDGLAGDLSDKQKKLVGIMADQTSKLRGLIEKLINFVTMEEGHLDITRETIELDPYLSEIAQESRSWFPDLATNITLTVEPANATFAFNKKYLRLIIGQLIENAMKFNVSEPVEIQVKCSQNERDTIFTISDNGVGIPSEYLDKIFDKFFQVEKYFTGSVEGVGLGLAYVKTLITHFGGTIDVKSTTGKGSIFTVTLHNK